MLSSWTKALGALVALLSAGCRPEDEGDTLLEDTNGAGTEAVSTGDVGATTVSICDGSNALRLAALRRNSGGQSGSDWFRQDLGYIYLYVAGTCEYWAFREADDEIDRVRTGILTDEAAAALTEEFSYATLEELAGIYADATADGTTGIVSDGARSISCYGGCPDAPERAKGAINAITPRVEQLWNDGTPYDGPIRVLAYEEPGLEPLEWPLPWPVSDIETMQDPSYLHGPSSLVADLADASAIREIFLSQPNLDNADSGVHVVDDTATVYEIVFRDSIPFEDDQGLIPLPAG